jgi:hypothetical protein
MTENKDKLKIEEEQQRLKEFLDILLETDLRTIKRLNEERHFKKDIDKEKQKDTG